MRNSSLTHTISELVALIVLAFSMSAAVGQELTPAQHGDFEHYTFALTWQPGFCNSGKGCASDQSRDELIGLHGLWASRPQTLIDQKIPRERWWREGCDLFQASLEQPQLPQELEADLHRVIPHTNDDLLTHEYDKHVQCFGFQPAAYFRQELVMRDAVVLSKFGSYLVAQSGHEVTRKAVIKAFAESFRTAAARAVQLRCESAQNGRAILTQFWMTIPTRKLSLFPASNAFENSPVVQDNCPATFTVPAWTE